MEPDEPPRADKAMEMGMFDMLPPAVRQALRDAPYGVPAASLWQWHRRGLPAAQLISIIEQLCAAERSR